MTTFFYDKKIKRFLSQIISVFSYFEVEFGDDNSGNPVYRRVPVKYATNDKMTASILKNNSENTMLNVPAMSVYITGLEYQYATLHYQQYHAHRKDQDLHTLLAVLYRPSDLANSHNPRHPQFSGDQRRNFNPANLERDAARMASLSKALQSTILFYFSCSLQAVTESHPRIFTTKSDSKAKRLGWIPVFRSLAQNKLELEKVWNLRMSRLLFEINQVIAETDALQSQLNKSRS